MTHISDQRPNRKHKTTRDTRPISVKPARTSEFLVQPTPDRVTVIIDGETRIDLSPPPPPHFPSHHKKSSGQQHKEYPEGKLSTHACPGKHTTRCAQTHPIYEVNIILIAEDDAAAELVQMRATSQKTKGSDDRLATTSAIREPTY